MEAASLTPSSYIVLGLIGRFGPATSYDLKQWADTSVGNFWSFSRAQLYKEPVRLKKYGYLVETKESSGRKKRVYSLSKLGQVALNDWLTQSSIVPTEIRDIGILKLYFADLLNENAKAALIQGQIEAHKCKLAEYKLLKKDLESEADWFYFLSTLEMGMRYETTAIEFWQDLAKKMET